jgi:hypothetical protein
MRKQVKVSVLLLCASGLAFADSADTLSNQSHTFLTIRPNFQGASPEKITDWRDRALARDCGYSGALQFVGFGGRSENPTDMGKYFMFSHKNSLVVAGNGVTDFVTDPNARDVNPIHFNIQPAGIDTEQNNFRSEITFKPRYVFGGVGIDWKQYLHGRDACEKKWWLEVSTPIMKVQTNVHLTENVTSAITPTTSANANMIEAFKGQTPFFNRTLNLNGEGTSGTITGSVWLYGKINGPQHKVRAADIEVRLGYDYLCEEMCHAEGYVGGLIPTGNTPNGEYVFEPIVGFNFNGGLIWGGSFGWEVWNSCDRFLHFEFETQGRYLFQNTQRRSVDVQNKPWSRYQLVYTSAAEAQSFHPTEGINLFTPEVRVTPRYIKDITLAFVYTHCGFNAEIGHNFWAHPTERVKLKDPFVTGAAFVGLDGTGYPIGTGNPKVGQVNRAITIRESFMGANESYVSSTAIVESDLDLHSAETPCSITNTFYGSLGYKWDCWCFPMFVGLGGSYELAADFGAINRWTLWGKLGFSY